MDFDALKELVKTITRNKVKQIEVLGNPGEEGSMVETLYDAIAREKVGSDEEAAKFLYGKNESPKSQAYLRLKGRLERSLLNTAFFVDVNQPMFNERAKAHFNCYRDFAAAYILLGREARKAGVHLLEQVLEQAVRYEFVELAAEIASRLRREHARIIGSASLHERFSRIHKEYEEKRRMEMIALDYFEDLINYYILRRSPNKDLHHQASIYYEELIPMVEQVDTSQFYFHTSQIGIIKYLSVNNCIEALKVCDESLEILKNRKNTNRNALVAIAIQKLSCITQLRVFEDQVANDLAQYCISLSEEGSFNWFRVHESFLHYCLFARRYADALAIFEKAAHHPKFDSLAGAVRDNWQLYGGYLHLLAAFGKLNTAEVQKIVGEFRFAKLNNEIEVVAKDKEGMNIPLVLLPVIHSLVKGNIEISAENLEKYRKRYLESDMNRRSAAFLNLLIAYARRDFKAHLVEKKIRKELDILASEQPKVAGQTFAVEIIPYEDLWEMLVEADA
ncbi:MAG: hypothetical protein SFV22_19385 [Saprospiraceae bacterium]|nr:hypothetical protein [Saprospiraceae bacterium]